MTAVELSENAEKLLKRIVDSKFGLGSGSSMFLIDAMVEHLSIEEARKLKVIDMKEELE